MSLADATIQIADDLERRGIEYRKHHSNIKKAKLGTVIQVVLSKSGDKILRAREHEVTKDSPDLRYWMNSKNGYPGKEFSFRNDALKDNEAIIDDLKSIAAIATGSDTPIAKMWTSLPKVLEKQIGKDLESLIDDAILSERIDPSIGAKLKKGAVVAISLGDDTLFSNEAFAELSKCLNNYNSGPTNATDAYGRRCNSSEFEPTFPVLTVPGGYSFKKQAPYPAMLPKSIVVRNNDSVNLWKYGLAQAAAPVSAENREKMVAALQFVLSPSQFMRTWTVDEDQQITAIVPVGDYTPVQLRQLEEIATIELEIMSAGGVGLESANVAHQRDEVLYGESAALLAKVSRKDSVLNPSSTNFVSFSYSVESTGPINASREVRYSLSEYSTWMDHWVGDLTFETPMAVSFFNNQQWNKREAMPIPLPYELIVAMNTMFKVISEKEVAKIPLSKRVFRGEHVWRLFTGTMSWGEMSQWLEWTRTISRSAVLHYSKQQILSDGPGSRYFNAYHKSILTLMSLQHLLCKRLLNGASLMDSTGYLVGKAVGLIDIMHIEYRRSLLLKRSKQNTENVEVSATEIHGWCAIASMSIRAGERLEDVRRRCQHSIRQCISLWESGYRQKPKVGTPVSWCQYRMAWTYQNYIEVMDQLTSRTDDLLGSLSTIDRMQLQMGYTSVRQRPQKETTELSPPAENISEVSEPTEELSSI